MKKYDINYSPVTPSEDLSSTESDLPGDYLFKLIINGCEEADPSGKNATKEARRMMWEEMEREKRI